MAQSTAQSTTKKKQKKEKQTNRKASFTISARWTKKNIQSYWKTQDQGTILPYLKQHN